MEGREDMEDYWNECRLMPSLPAEEDCGSRSCEEGEIEAEWLEDVGLTNLTAAFKQGRELTAGEVDEVLLHFSSSQAEAVRRRVRTLNNTVRQRKSRARHRKADVRDVFKDAGVQDMGAVPSTPPDSLDSGQFTTTIHLGSDSQQRRKRLLARYPSVPLAHREIFRKNVPDVPGTDGLPLVRYKYLGTLPRHRSGSDPLFLDESSMLEECALLSSSRLSRSHGNLLDISDSYRKTSLDESDRTWIDSLDPSDVEQLKPLLLAEATTIMDDYCTPDYKRKPLRSSGKPEGNVFGVSLATLLERDERAFKGDVGHHPYVPAILQTLVNHLERNHLREEGLLRVAGVKTRIDALTANIEANFYLDKQAVDQLLFTVSPHDVTAALKKILRELPEPLLTYKLIYKFYSTHGMENEEIQKYVLNLLILQLPREHRATLLFLFRFVQKMLELEEFNKMGEHSIATILAPSLFPPRYVTQSKEDMVSQVLLAENCIELTEKLLLTGESLWLVPRKLIHQLRTRNQKENRKPNLFRTSRVKDTSRKSYPSGTILVEAAQFDLPQFPIRVTETLTAREVVLQVVKEGMSKYEGSERCLREPLKVLPRARSKPLAELAPPGMALSCVLSGAAPETALQSHFLVEFGGNIVQRELEHAALVKVVLRDNPDARWRLECRHRNCPKR